jgi:hypothetical protein
MASSCAGDLNSVLVQAGAIGTLVAIIREHDDTRQACRVMDVICTDNGALGGECLIQLLQSQQSDIVSWLIATDS